MRARSPNYPAISLPDAIEKVRGIYKEAHRRKLSRAEIAKLLGYGGLNGASITGISALTKYGLLEGRGDEIRVSEDAVIILAETVDSPDRIEAIRRAAFKPELFAELMEGQTQAPGENAVRIRLERKGFTAKAAQAATRSFRETMALVEEQGRDYNGPVEEPSEVPSGGSMQPLAPAAQAAQVGGGRSPVSIPPAPAATGQGALWLQVPFKGTTLTVRVDAGGEVLTKEHVARVRKYLAFAEADLGGEEDATENQED